MATYVLVHGAWSGGWCWSPVARRLRAAGHDVFAPTLTGQGERAHLFSLEVGLDTHVRDVVGVLELEECADVVLVGHGYGGVVITAAAEEVPSRLGNLVYVDAFVPVDGRSTFDLLPPDVRQSLRQAARERGEGLLIPGDGIADLFAGADPGARRWVAGKLTPFPLRCFEQPVRLPGEAASTLPRTYVSATTGPGARLFAPYAERARREEWDFHEVPTGGASWLRPPEEIASVLLSLRTPQGAR
jgi:pimeloyl-ACP methyl ester carboxylesterase